LHRIQRKPIAPHNLPQKRTTGGLSPPGVTYSEPNELRLRDESSLFLGLLTTTLWGSLLLGCLLLRRLLGGLALLCHDWLLLFVEVLRWYYLLGFSAALSVELGLNFIVVEAAI
jgi:hypothetical protein